MKIRVPISAIYVSTYIPQKCGIATFTKDVTTAINLLNPHALAEIMAVVKAGENPDFPWEVKYRINRDDRESYSKAVREISNNGYEVVVIEHEFGIFGGKCGEYLLDFMEGLEAIKKPKIMTCHTIIEDPDNEWGQAFQKVIKLADGFTVMAIDSAVKLMKLYGIPKNKIAFIPHGTPDLTYDSSEPYKKAKGLEGRVVLGNINLLSENKGVDYAIEAVAEIAKTIPEVIYLSVGQTHPNILAAEGEKYRDHLEAKIDELGIRDNFRFVNRYLPLPELIEWLRAIDIYITPYLDPQQSSSGALAYAVGAGKPCISTEYLYAQEVLDEGRGILVPFRDSGAIAREVVELWQNPDKRKQMEKKAYKYSRFMTWPAVALQHLDFFREVIDKYGTKC